MLFIEAVSEGIPHSVYEAIQCFPLFRENEWASFLNISTKSLQRDRDQSTHVFKRTHSEKNLEIAELTRLGLDVFGEMEKFELWLRTPVYALGKRKPIDLIKFSSGRRLVVRELRHIDQGILV